MFEEEANSNLELKARLTEKLSKIEENAQKIPEVDLRVHRLENLYETEHEKIQIQRLTKERQINQFDQEVMRVEQAFKTTKRFKDGYSDRQSYDFDFLEKKMMNQSTAMTEEMKIIRKGVLEAMDKKFKTFNSDAISTLNQDFQLLSKQNQSQVNEKLAELEKLVEEEEQNRNNTAQLLINSFGEQVLKLEEAISLEKYDRVESNQKIKNSIKDLEEFIDGLFEQEERESEIGRQTVEKRLQEVCYRIQAKILGKN